ncbi:phosphodiester glycosidase family protein [Nodosilinea sp. LEGE 07088]|uniref:phosphodiester glycosidase family protein n=1 Tax=Nodosilinea sp. LEGE 07088 TaxID=2777968 RepID=UPI0018823774|nr:phosphodiester glycosidase family protein [Nodosilinea sp. LEGE 07088]MBE9139205.1 phosphodiester glycosidase family protein [Nodosilinea sp. LEGE 07088]
MIPLLLYSGAQGSRPSRTPLAESLFAGVTYRREVEEQPWPQVVHIVTIDLETGVEVLASPGTAADDDFETTAQTTSKFLTQNNLDLAVNANFFFPFEEKTPWNFYPRRGDRTNVLGTAIANGEVYSAPEADWPALCFSADNRAQIVAGGTCPDGTRQAIAGNQQLVAAGTPVPFDFADRPYARVMAAVSEGGDRLWLVVVDGKQPRYSEGATLGHLTQIALDLGADAAINLDGGGSTTLAVSAPDGRPRLLNAPVHTKLPMRQRPVANHLGFRAVSPQ